MVVVVGVQTDECRTVNSCWKSCFGTVVVVVAVVVADVVVQRSDGAFHHRNAVDCIREICMRTCSVDVGVEIIVGVGDVERVGYDGAVVVVDIRYADELDVVEGDSSTDDGTGPLDACSDGLQDVGGELVHRKLAVARYAEDHWRWVLPYRVDDAAGATVVEPAGFVETEAFAASLLVIRVPCPMVEEILNNKYDLISLLDCNEYNK